MVTKQDIKYLGMGIRNLLSAYSSHEKFISGLETLLALGYMEQTDCINIISTPTPARKPCRDSAAYQLAYSGKLYKKDGNWTFRERDSFVPSYQTRGLHRKNVSCKPYEMVKKVLEEFAPPSTYLPDLLASHTPREIRGAFTLHMLANDRLELASPLIELPYKQYELLKKHLGGNTNDNP